MANPLQLAEFLCARLCHDLSGPIGSLVGALDLATDGDGDDREILAVANESAQALAQRLRLLRAAWVGDCGSLSVSELVQLASGLPSGKKTRLDVSGLEDIARFPPQVARLVLNLVLLAAESLPRGGRVVLAGSPTGDVVVMIDGPGAAWPPGMALCFADEAAAWSALVSARGVQAPVTALIARQSGLG